MKSKFVSRGGVTVNLGFVTSIERLGHIIIFYGETVWADHEDNPSGWEEDRIAKFRYNSDEECAEAEKAILAYVGAIQV